MLTTLTRFFSACATVACIGLLSSACAFRWQCVSCGAWDGLLHHTGFLTDEGVTLKDRTQRLTRTYEGDVRDGRPDGDGVLTFENGFRIGGAWQASELVDGPGWLEFPDGARFESNWNYDSETVWHKRKGAASICIKNDCQNGPGIALDQNIESIYVGEFRNGRFWGRGALFWKYRLLPATADSNDPVKVIEPDFYIYAGNFVGGELSEGTLFCLRHLKFCRYLVSVHQRSQKPGATVRAEWVNNYGFFKDRTRPLLAEFKEAARYLSAAGVN